MGIALLVVTLLSLSAPDAATVERIANLKAQGLSAAEIAAVMTADPYSKLEYTESDVEEILATAPVVLPSRPIKLARRSQHNSTDAYSLSDRRAAVTWATFGSFGGAALATASLAVAIKTDTIGSPSTFEHIGSAAFLAVGLTALSAGPALGYFRLGQIARGIGSTILRSALVYGTFWLAWYVAAARPAWTPWVGAFGGVATLLSSGAAVSRTRYSVPLLVFRF